MQNKLSSSKAVIRKVETLAEWYILLDSLLFKITPTPEKKEQYWQFQKYVLIEL